MQIGLKHLEEKSIQNNMKISCVCSFCGKQTDTNISLEFNFLQRKIYWYCGECHKMNNIDFQALKDIQPLPRMRMS